MLSLAVSLLLATRAGNPTLVKWRLKANLLIMKPQQRDAARYRAVPFSFPGWQCSDGYVYISVCCFLFRGHKFVISSWDHPHVASCTKLIWQGNHAHSAWNQYQVPLVSLLRLGVPNTLWCSCCLFPPWHVFPKNLSSAVIQTSESCNSKCKERCHCFL